MTFPGRAVNTAVGTLRHDGTQPSARPPLPRSARAAVHPVLAVAGTAAGAVAAVVAYQAGTSTPADAAASTPGTAAVTSTPTVAPTPSRRVVWKDCREGHPPAPRHVRAGEAEGGRGRGSGARRRRPRPAPVEQQVAARGPGRTGPLHATRSTGQHAGSGQTRDDGQRGPAQPADPGPSTTTGRRTRATTPRTTTGRSRRRRPSRPRPTTESSVVSPVGPAGGH